MGWMDRTDKGKWHLNRTSTQNNQTMGGLQDTNGARQKRKRADKDENEGSERLGTEAKNVLSGLLEEEWRRATSDAGRTAL